MGKAGNFVDNEEQGQEATAPYESIWAYYADEMKLLDIQLYALYEESREEAADSHENSFRGMYISESEFIRLIGCPRQDMNTPELLRSRQEASLLRKHIAERLALSRSARRFLPLPYLSSVFGLTPLEEEVVLLALAVELDRKYERIFGFLHDDMTFKRPSLGLAQLLFTRSEKALEAMRQIMEPGRTLDRYLLSKDINELPGRSRLARPLSLTRRISDFLLGSTDPNCFFTDGIRFYTLNENPAPLLIQAELQDRILAVMKQKDQHNNLGVLLWGNPGAGKKLQIRHIAHKMGRSVLIADVREIRGEGSEFADQLDDVMREALLQRALLVYEGVEILFPITDSPSEHQLEKQRLLRNRLKVYPEIVFMISERRIPLVAVMPDRIWHEAELAVPDERERIELWRRFGDKGNMPGDETLWRLIAGKFRLTPGQIQGAIARAEAEAVWNAKAPSKLYTQACYGLVQHRLERRAVRVEPHYGWDDIVLPQEQKELLRDACNQIKYRSRVYGEWGFARKLAYGKGLSMLFAGPPGTGKTMSAQVIARELELEMYKIDLSQIISKYIGETEQHLHELFREAELSHAVLFFDETDALFGKRSEVKDAQDKYANIETAYLLQKMEEYSGITILATNLQGNMDEAFLRRIQFIVKFPFPDANYRRQIWSAMFPAETPLASDLDIDLLAVRHEIAGGNIKNIAVSAAFLAAAEGEPVRMRHVEKALRHELQKSGKLVSRSEFQSY